MVNLESGLYSVEDKISKLNKVFTSNVLIKATRIRNVDTTSQTDQENFWRSMIFYQAHFRIKDEQILRHPNACPSSGKT